MLTLILCSPSQCSTSVANGVVEHTIQLERYRTQLHALLDMAVQSISDRAVSVYVMLLLAC